MKNSFTIEGELSGFFGNMKKPSISKCLYGLNIQRPTSYRVYETTGGTTTRTWVFGDIEINPKRQNVKKVAAIES